MLTRVDIQNYRSIYKASVLLSPFTLLIGANGTGKSNFLRLLKESSETNFLTGAAKQLPRNSKHYAHSGEEQRVAFYSKEGEICQICGTSLICIENIDSGFHPRLFQQIVELCFELSEKENGVQIIATTHNPYFVDQFEDRESAILIVEKQNGQTTFATLSDRLGDADVEEMPLGELWYSGIVGGVPLNV